MLASKTQRSPNTWRDYPLNPRISLPGRIGVFVFSGLLLFFPVYAMVSEKGFVGDTGTPLPGIAVALICTVCTIFGCWGMWVSLIYKARTLKELDEEAVLTSHDQPSNAPDAIVCRYSLGTKAGGVFVDTNARLISFQNCHTPRGFLTSTDEWFTCPITDIKRVHDSNVYKAGRCLTIITGIGGVRIPQTLADYSDIRDTLRRLVAQNDPGFLLHDPAFQIVLGLVIAGGGFLGVFAGWWLSPKNATDSILAVCIVGGTTLGIVGSLLLTSLADRFLQSKFRTRQTKLE
jgi:hypothetical protein